MVKAFRITTPDLERKDTYKLPCDVTLSKYISPLIDSRDWKTSTPKYIRIEAQGLTNTDKAIINFIDTEGRGYGNTFSIKPDMQQILIPVSALRPTKGVILPQEYPGGITPYYYPASTRDNDNVPLKWENIDFVQISLRDEIYPVGTAERQRNNYKENSIGILILFRNSVLILYKNMGKHPIGELSHAFLIFPVFIPDIRYV